MIQLGDVFKKHKIMIAVACLAVIGVLSALFLTAQPSIDWMEDLAVEDVSTMEIVTYAPGSTHVAYQPTQEEKTAVVMLCNSFDGTQTQWEVIPTEEKLRVTMGMMGATTHTLILYVKEATNQVTLQADEQYFLLDENQTATWLRLVETLGKAETPPTVTSPTPTPDSAPYGITLTATDVTSTGMTLVCTQSGGGEYYTGEKYVIERLENHTWMPLTAASDMWYDIAWNIASDGTIEWELDWSYLYGDLEAGTYRLSKEIYGGKDATNEATYYTQFEVPEERIHPVTGEVTPSETILIHRQLADVTHDGLSDIIETTMTTDAADKDLDLNELFDKGYTCDVAIYNGISSVNTPIYQRTYGRAHTGNGQLSLIEQDGQYYLLEGSLYVGQGDYTFSHTVFSLDDSGNQQVVDEDLVEGTLSDADAYHIMESYLRRLNPWITDATAIAMVSVSLEQQMVTTDDTSYPAEGYYATMIPYYQEMTNGAYPVGDPKPLSPDELAYFNETYFNTEPMMSNLNLANQFLHSTYETPADIDLYMLFYLGAGADYAMDDFGGEYDAVAQAYGFDSWADIPTDVTPIPKASMDYMLNTYTGTTLVDSNKVGLDGFRYLEEYDCYYNLHGDTNYFGNVEFTSGTQMGDEFRLYYTQYSYGQERYVLTLHKVDDQYFIYSNLQG